MKGRVLEKAHAKVNLFLRVLGPRPDGYHDLVSVAHKVELHDLVILERVPGPGITVESDDPSVPSGRGNLAHAACEELLGRLGLSASEGISVFIRKRIPVAAGLGGGSADAAAALKGLCRLLSVDLPIRELEVIAGRIGSDVPFFLGGPAAVMTGRGEAIRPLEPLPHWLVLATPSVMISTKEAYAWLDALRGPQIPAALPRLDSIEGGLPPLHNDFEPPVSRRVPQISLLKRKMADLGALGSVMSGSGPTVAALCPDRQSARMLARGIEAEDVRVTVTRFLEERSPRRLPE